MSDDDGMGDFGEAHETAVTPSSTGNGGKPRSTVDSGPQDDELDPVKAALAGARGITRGREVKRPRRRKKQPDAAGRGGYSGAWPDDTDPRPVGDVLSGYLQDRGWEKPIAQARVFTDWESIVGPEVAAHCAPVALNEGELKLSAESTAWATQLRMLGGTLLARVVAELGPTVVTRIVVTGPTGPSWKHGKFSVRGQRGPRDTYG